VFSYPELRHGHITALGRPHPVVLRDADLVAGARPQAYDGLSACCEDVADHMRLTIGAHDTGRAAHQGVYPAPALGGRDEHVPGHARVARVDAARARAGVPIMDRRVELHARIAARPGRL